MGWNKFGLFIKLTSYQLLLSEFAAQRPKQNFAAEIVDAERWIQLILFSFEIVVFLYFGFLHTLKRFEHNVFLSFYKF